MRHPRITIAAIAVAIAGAIGGFIIASASGSSSSSSSSTASISGSTTIARSAATVQTATATVQGTAEPILVDGHGLPLYIYEPDTTVTSRVSGQLAALWPPLIAAAPTTAGAIGRLTSVATSNGKQVAYNGHFLYTFVEDSPGHVTGQGVQNFFVATPSLIPGASNAMTVAPAKPGYSYGY